MSLHVTIHKLLLWLLVALIFTPALCPAAGGGGRRDIPMPARLVLSKAGNLINQKAYDKALVLLTDFRDRGAALDATPGASDPKGYHHPEIFYAIGTCHLLQENYPQAAQAFERTLALDSSHINAWLNQAKVCCELNNYGKAADCFAAAYTQGGQTASEHLYYCAVTYLMADQPRASIDAFEKLFARHPDAVSLQWRENFVQALLAGDRGENAIPYIRVLAEQYQGEKQIQWQEILLHQYMALDWHKQALAYARFLTGQAPTRAKWWQALAHVHLQAGSYEPALIALTIYGYLAPLTDQETRLLADLHLQLGIPVKAVPLYERLLVRNADARSVPGLVTALRQLGRPEQALKVLDGLDKAAMGPALLMLKADLLYTLERFGEAADAYQQVARRDDSADNQGRAWLMAGYAALQADDLSTGRKAFQKAVAFDRQRKAARLALKQMPDSDSSPAGRRSPL